MTTTWMSIEVRDGQWNHKSDHMRAGLARRSLQRASRVRVRDIQRFSELKKDFDEEREIIL
jgi:hypothetical protein